MMMLMMMFGLCRNSIEVLFHDHWKGRTPSVATNNIIISNLNIFKVIPSLVPGTSLPS